MFLFIGLSSFIPLIFQTFNRYSDTNEAVGLMLITIQIILIISFVIATVMIWRKLSSTPKVDEKEVEKALSKYDSKEMINVTVLNSFISDSLGNKWSPLTTAYAVLVASLFLMLYLIISIAL
jgi:magnesium-transporting ATPase (P-type)